MIPNFRSDNQVNIALSGLSLYCIRGLGVPDNKPVFFSTLPIPHSAYNLIELLDIQQRFRSPFPSNCPRYVDQGRYFTNVVNEQGESDASFQAYQLS